jgi:hypothetical protein
MERFEKEQRRDISTKAVYRKFPLIGNYRKGGNTSKFIRSFGEVRRFEVLEIVCS